MTTDYNKELQELKENYPIQIEMQSRLSWIQEANNALDLLTKKPLSIYLELFATEEPSLEEVAKSSHHYACVRDCLNDTDPEMILRDCLIEAFRQFKIKMVSQCNELIHTKL